MPLDPISTEKYLETLKEATASISNALSILPETHLLAAVERGFKLWAHIGNGEFPEFLVPVLQTVVDAAKEAVHAEFAAIGVGRSPYVPFRPWTVSANAQKWVDQIGRIPRAVGLLGWVAREGKSIRVRDVREHPVFRGLPPGHPSLTSFLGVPIRYLGTTIGNLYMGNKQNAVEFSETDQAIAEILADYAAIALQQAYLQGIFQSQQSQLQSILESAPSGIIFTDINTGQVVANPRAMQLFGQPISRDLGRSQYLRSLLTREGKPLRLEELPSTLACEGKGVSSQEMQIVQPDGTHIPILVDAAPVLGLERRILGSVVIFEEITALKELERMRQEFAAMVAHDLRNPIQAILSQSALLLREEKEAKIAESVDRIQKNALHLARLTGDLMDLARIELSQMDIDPHPVQIVQALEHLLERLKPSLNGHPVRLEKEGEIPVVSADLFRLEQIFSNLLDNAAKYSPPGSPIGIRIRCDSTGVFITVENQGPGIPKEELPWFFERRFQSRSAGKKRTGLGLGLQIVKGLVAAHQGKVSVESEPGHGVRITVWLPTLSSRPEPSARS